MKSFRHVLTILCVQTPGFTLGCLTTGPASTSAQNSSCSGRGALRAREIPANPCLVKRQEVVLSITLDYKHMPKYRDTSSFQLEGMNHNTSPKNSSGSGIAATFNLLLTRMGEPRGPDRDPENQQISDIVEFCN